MRISLLLPLLALTWPGFGAAADPVEGYWLTQNRKAIVETRTCGTKICGRMVWLADPTDAGGKLKLGANGKPLCGVELIGDLKEKGPNRWGGGWVLDPRSGDRYSATLALVSPEKIKLRGFLGLPFLGKSQIWTRVPDARGGC